nr:DUF2141 domain-containing protein [Sphingomonas prati]
MLLATLALLPGASPAGRVDLGIAGLRSTKGNVMVCLTTAPTHFPDCQNDPAARKTTVPAATAAALRFDWLPSADYAVAMVHDENGNGKLDTFVGMPREGFGFSRNPAIRFGPPRFSSARFAVAGGPVAERVKVKYLL